MISKNTGRVQYLTWLPHTAPSAEESKLRSMNAGLDGAWPSSSNSDSSGRLFGPPYGNRSTTALTPAAKDRPS